MHHSVYDEKLNLLIWVIRLIFSDQVTNISQLCSIYYKEVKSNPKTASPAVKKVCGPQEGHCENRCEIQGGGQEMAVLVG